MCYRVTKQKEASNTLYHIPVLVKDDKYIVNHLTVVNKQLQYLKNKITENHRTFCNDDKSTVSKSSVRKHERNIALRTLVRIIPKLTWMTWGYGIQTTLASSEQGQAEGSTMNFRFAEGTIHFLGHP
jgi:hypothetical protein